jgi:hypothetical protein
MDSALEAAAETLSPCQFQLSPGRTPVTVAPRRASTPSHWTAAAVVMSSILGAVSRVLTEHTTGAATGSPAVIAPALLLGGVLVLLSAGAIQRLGTRDRLNEWIGYGLALAVLPVLLPFAWIHYWVLAMVLLVAVVRSARLRRLGRLSG